MMEVKEALDVGAEEFFSQLVVSVLYDIKSSTGEETEEETLRKGYCYTKRMKNKVGKQGDVEVEILEFQPPSRYGAAFKSYSGTNRIQYEIEKQGQGILVTYTEGYDGDTKSQNLNYKIIGALYKNQAKKRTKAMLHEMERYIKQNRKGQEEGGSAP